MVRIGFYYWYRIFGFISLLSLYSFIDFEQPNISPCLKSTKAHPFLCDKKILLKKASMPDLLSAGLSLKKAESIYAFIKEHQECHVEDLLVIKGIGPKTLENIKNYFY